jgi:hypothetical protein
MLFYEYFFSPYIIELNLVMKIYPTYLISIFNAEIIGDRIIQNKGSNHGASSRLVAAWAPTLQTNMPCIAIPVCAGAGLRDALSGEIAIAQWHLGCTGNMSETIRGWVWRRGESKLVRIDQAQVPQVPYLSLPMSLTVPGKTCTVCRMEELGREVHPPGRTESG